MDSPQDHLPPRANPNASILRRGAVVALDADGTRAPPWCHDWRTAAPTRYGGSRSSRPGTHGIAPSCMRRHAPRLQPSLDDTFGLREKLDRMVAVRVEITEETVPPSTERERGHRLGHADIDPDVANLRLVAESTRRLPIVG